MDRRFCAVYIITNTTNTTFYTGVTNNLIRRGYEHRAKLIEGFSKKYHLWKLVYFEPFEEITEAIKREKQIKGGSRSKKLTLITKENPEFTDLYPLVSA